MRVLFLIGVVCFFCLDVLCATKKKTVVKKMKFKRHTKKGSVSGGAAAIKHSSAKGEEDGGDEENGGGETVKNICGKCFKMLKAAGFEKKKQRSGRFGMSAAKAGFAARGGAIKGEDGEVSAAKAGFAARGGAIKGEDGEVSAAKAGFAARGGAIKGENGEVSAAKAGFAARGGAMRGENGEVKGGPFKGFKASKRSGFKKRRKCGLCKIKPSKETPDEEDETETPKNKRHCKRTPPKRPTERPSVEQEPVKRPDTEERNKNKKMIKITIEGIIKNLETAKNEAPETKAPPSKESPDTNDFSKETKTVSASAKGFSAKKTTVKATSQATCQKQSPEEEKAVQEAFAVLKEMEGKLNHTALTKEDIFVLKEIGKIIANTNTAEEKPSEEIPVQKGKVMMMVLNNGKGKSVQEKIGLLKGLKQAIEKSFTEAMSQE
ncbi:MAG: uncharacterized protein A8A55_0518 [Amphiamblys sp. WSBS2006]|nr:MAG: uncharacterized protein A8A55_0518 [Amphiamblys sp. WSBS2006]